jgi:hypothetical protein
MVLMSQSTQQLEARLARVEKEVAELKAALGAKRLEPWYRQIVGHFADDRGLAVLFEYLRRVQ